MREVFLDKDSARDFLTRKKVQDYKFMDRYNLELLVNSKLSSGKIHANVLPDLLNHCLGTRVAYGFNYCLSHPITNRNVTENLLEIPVLKEFLARGCKISFIGKSSKKFEGFHPDMKDYSGEWKKLPTPYKPIADWIEDCLENYETRYGMEFPKADVVVTNAFPSFFFSNMMFYLINLHYAKTHTPVFLWDYELRTLRTSEKDNLPKKYFRYSGADKIFSVDQFKTIADNAYWLLQIPGEALDRIKSLNPRIRILPFFPPYSFQFGQYNICPKTIYRLAYIGNDSERRQTFRKFFTPLEKKNRLDLFGGGMSRRAEGYENFEKYIGNTEMHGPIPQGDVWKTYNQARTCLSIARPRYYEMGWIVHRWFEVILSGCILLVPGEMHGIRRYMSKYFIVNDAKELDEKIQFFNDKLTHSKLLQFHQWQKRFIYRLFNSERCVDVILRVIGK